MIDNLTLTYSGNQLLKVEDVVTSPNQPLSMDFKNDSNQAVEYEYDENGNLTKDLNKRIVDIQYNCLNLPCRIVFENGNSVSYIYAANGIKLRTTHEIGA